MFRHIRSFSCQATLLLLLFAITSCGSLWVQYQQRKVSLSTQLATGKITGRIYDQKMAELEKWYERGGRTSSGSRRKSNNTTKSVDDSISESSAPAYSAPGNSNLNTSHPLSNDGMHDVTRKTKSGLNEF